MAGARGGAIQRMVPAGMLTSAQLAERSGVSPDTIRRWREVGVLPPCDTMKVGVLEVHLYSEGQIKDAKKLKRTAGATVKVRARKVGLPLAS